MRIGRGVIVLAALIAFEACDKKGATPPVALTATMADSAEQVMSNVRLLLTDKGVERGELFADTAFVFDDNTRFELRKVRATFNTPTGAKDGVLSANRGRYSTRQSTLEGFGNVTIVTNDGKRLTSPQLTYTQAINQVSSDTNFTMVEPGRTLTGVGFRADPQLTHFRILRGGNTRGSLDLPAQ